MSKIREILQLQQRELEGYKKKKYVPRDIKLSALDKDIIKVIIGPRRAGKSFFAVHELNQELEKFGYVNFDDPSLIEPEYINEVIGEISNLYHDPKCIFLDEIQNFPKWELLVNRLQR